MNTQTLIKFKQITQFSKDLKIDPWREIPESILIDFQELSTVQKRHCNDFYQLGKESIIFNIIENVTLYRNYYNLNLLDFLVKNEIKMNKHDTAKLNALEKNINEKPKFTEFFQLFPVHYGHNIQDNLSSVKNILNQQRKNSKTDKMGR